MKCIIWKKNRSLKVQLPVLKRHNPILKSYTTPKSKQGGQNVSKPSKAAMCRYACFAVTSHRVNQVAGRGLGDRSPLYLENVDESL